MRRTRDAGLAILGLEALSVRPALPVGQNTPPPRQPLFAKIFHFTEIRNCGITRNSPAHGRGAVRESFETRAGLRWTRQRRAREARAGRVVPVSPRLRADERRRSPVEPLGEAGSAAYGKTVWSWPSLLRSSLLRRCARAQPGGRHRQFAGRGRPEGTRLPGEHGISRPTIAQGRPSDRRHLYAAVRFSACAFCAADRGCRSAPGLPCALFSLGRGMQAKLGRDEPRGCEAVPATPHSPSSPAKAGDPVFQRRM